MPPSHHHPHASVSAPTPLLSLPALPRAGARVDLPTLAGSSDALALAEIAGRAGGRLLAVVTASAADAQRLLDEIPWFAPGLRVRLLPDWETLPYDHFSPHQDLVSERLATLWAAMRGRTGHPAGAGVDRGLPAGAAGLPRRLHLRLPEGRTARCREVPRPGDAGRLRPRDAGGVAGRILDPRRADRPLPDGVAGAVPARPVRRRDREHQDLRRRYPAHHLPGAGRAPAAGARIPARRQGAHALPPALPRGLRGRPGQVGHLQGRFHRHRQRRHRVLPAAVLR